jgi:hypothetical protein
MVCFWVLILSLLSGCWSWALSSWFLLLNRILHSGSYRTGFRILESWGF